MNMAVKLHLQKSDIVSINQQKEFLKLFLLDGFDSFAS